MFSSWKKQLVLPIIIGSTLVAASSIEGADTRRRKGLRRASRGMNRRLDKKDGIDTCDENSFTVPDTSKLGAEIFTWTPGKTNGQGFNKKGSEARKLVDNGIGKDSFNKYAWSSALDNDGCIYIGTITLNCSRNIF